MVARIDNGALVRLHDPVGCHGGFIGFQKPEALRFDRNLTECQSPESAIERFDLNFELYGALGSEIVTQVAKQEATIGVDLHLRVQVRGD